jgi:DNA polymerase-3 subunit gamma/tau
MLGTIDHRVVFELLKALAESDGAKLVQLVASMSEFAPDYAGVLAEMISILHRIALAQVVPDAIDNALGDKAQVVDLAARMRAEEVQLYYQIALTGRKDLPMVPQPREGLEMTLLRMLAFRPADQRPINAAPVVESAAVSTPIAPAPAPAPAPAESAPALRAEPPAPTHSAPEPSVVDRPPVSSNEPPPWDEEPMPVDAYGDEASKKPETDVPVTAAPDAEAVGSASVTDSQGSVAEDSQESFEEADVAEESEEDSEQDALPEVEADTADLKAATDTSSINLSSGLAPEPATSLAALQLPHWLRLVEALGLSGMTESLARSLSLESISGNKLALHYTREQEALLNDVHKARISEALQGYFAEPLAIEFVLGEQLQETPQLYRQRRDRERRAAALAHLQADPAVQQIIETFSAEILSDSVEPLNIE